MYIVEHDKENQQFIIRLENKVATLKYHVLPGREVWDLYSTLVPPQFRGRSIGLYLVQYALDFAKKHHHQIIPTCPFVQHYIDLNPEYEKMIYKDI